MEKKKHILFGEKFISDSTLDNVKLGKNIEIISNDEFGEKKIEINGEPYLDEKNNIIVPITVTNMESFELPLELIWTPLENITTFELAKCLLYINHTGIYFESIFKNSNMELKDDMRFLRHFLIINHNKIQNLIKTDIKNLNNTKSFFCYDNCTHLSITEEEQINIKDGNNLFHYCKKYHCHVKHGSYHPHLVKSEFCDYDNSETRVPFKMED